MPADESMTIDKTGPHDLQAILELQRLCFREAAERYHDPAIPPLTQTLAELKDEFTRCILLKIEINSRIIGSARAWEQDGTAYIGRVIVHPAFQNQGLGKKLMAAIEAQFPKTERFELFTGCRDEKNIAFYHHLGYEIFRSEEDRHLVFMEKVRVSVAPAGEGTTDNTDQD
jgi:ribosomal protein S18 acetylase RimI-like enzyme